MRFEIKTMKFKSKTLKPKKKKKGFTLIELVAVLAIIAILSAAFVPKFGKYITEAKKVAVLNEAKTVVTAYESVRHKINTSEDKTSISSLLSNDYLEEGSIKKINLDFSVAECKQLMDTENYTFDIDSASGCATNIRQTQNSSTESTPK
ncbi:type II secretion system protein [Clostridium sp.]|uniref:type II secretion system protein n=1 Tax=Clostridium sp. TaxID=1506 RepID=UPI0025B91995|nr:type II secretion system protein [Clostridium sp.]